MLRLRDAQGFTVIELMVTTVILAVVMLTVLTVHMASERQQESSFRNVQAGEHLRVGLDWVARDIRMAGSGFGNIPIYAGFGGSPVPLRYAVYPQPSASATADSFEVMGGQRRIVGFLAAQMSSQSTPIQVDTTLGFQVGDMVVVSNGTRGHLFQVTGIAGNTLEHLPGPSAWNQGGAAGWPATGYDTGSRVSQVDWVRYYIDQSDPKVPTLMRWNAADAAPAFVAKSVDRFAVTYREGGAVVASPSNPLNVREVLIDARTVAGGDAQDATLPRRTLSTAAVPRLFE